MPFVRGIYLMNYACAQKFSCYGPIFQLPFSDELVQCTVALYIASVLYWILFLYLDSVLPREYGIPKPPLFFLDPIINLFRKKRRDRFGKLKKKKSREHQFEKYVLLTF